MSASPSTSELIRRRIMANLDSPGAPKRPEIAWPTASPRHRSTPWLKSLIKAWVHRSPRFGLCLLLAAQSILPLVRLVRDFCSWLRLRACRAEQLALVLEQHLRRKKAIRQLGSSHPSS